MPATALPESGHEDDGQQISLPFNFYFGARNCPHWSTYSQSDVKARRDAESVRNVEKDQRMREVRRLSDKCHAAKQAVEMLVALDGTGRCEAAAGHLVDTARQLLNEAMTVAQNIQADAAGWRINGRAALADVDESVDKVKASTVTEAQVLAAFGLPADATVPESDTSESVADETPPVPKRPSPAEMAKIVEANRRNLR